MKNIRILLPFVVWLLLAGGTAQAQDREAGNVLTVSRDVTLFHAGTESQARPRDPLYQEDAVATGGRSRAKLFFRDDSVLNLGELSRLEVQEYLQSADTDRSRAVYSLVEGSLRAVVGRSDLQIHSPTAVAAARGTRFLMAVRGDGVGLETLIIVLEGEVTARSIIREILEIVTLRQGEMTRVPAGRPPEPATPTPPRLLEQYRTGTLALGDIFRDRPDALALTAFEGVDEGRTAGQERRPGQRDVAGKDTGSERTVWDSMRDMGQPPISQEPLRATGSGLTPVNVNIRFPEGQ